MDKELEKFESQIKAKHRFALTPAYEEETPTFLKGKQFTAVVLKTFEKLDWTVVYYNDETAEAKRKDDFGTSTEKISVTLQYGKVIVRSISLKNDFWDVGRNSKRVKLFIHAFQRMSQELSSEQLAELKDEREREDTMADYVIPQELPPPITHREPNFLLVVVGGLVTSLLVGLLLAFPCAHGFYIIGFFEFIVGFIFGIVLNRLIRYSNYTTYNNLNYLLIAMVILACTSSQFFQFRILVPDYSTIDFVQFMRLRLEAGLIIKKLDTGTIGLIVSWILQLGLIYGIGVLRMGSALIEFSLERVPQQVVDFALYHSLQNKTEDAVRKELAKKGWKNETDQNYVIEALGAITTARELNRN